VVAEREEKAIQILETANVFPMKVGGKLGAERR
jgi:hypothetical protein